MDKETLLTLFMTRSERLTQILDGVPHVEFERPGAIGSRSIKEVCALLTAWDGEAMRRIDYVTGHRLDPPHDLHDSPYWDIWLERQVAVKRVMPVRGVLVDMVGTRQRLLTRLADLDNFHVERWLAIDPQATQPYFQDYLVQAQTWRIIWNETHPQDKRHPILAGLITLWQSIRWWKK